MFLLLLFDLLDCSWSDLLFISAMIKPFEFIKVLVSSVCTVPNARNTRRSTALGETPLIWYCARYPEPFNPTVDSSLCWVWLWHAERKCALLWTQFHSLTVCCMHSSTAASPSLQSFPNSFRGIGGLEGIQVLKRGKVFEVPRSFAAISNNQKKKKENKKTKLKRETSSGGHRVWTDEKSMVYIAQWTVTWRWNCVRFFSRKLADHTDRWAS